MFDTEQCDDQQAGKPGSSTGTSSGAAAESQPAKGGLALVDTLPADEVSATEVLEELERVVGLLGEVDWRGVDGEALGHVVVGLSATKAVLVAAELGACHAFDRSGYWRSVGARAPHAFVRRRRRMRDAEAKRQFARARKSEDMRHVLAALAKGRLTLDHFDVFSHACSSGREELFSRDEAILVAQSLRLSYKDFRQMMAYWIQRADEAIGRDGPGDRREGRRVHCSPSIDGTMMLDGQLDGLAGSEFKNELERLTDIEFRSDWQAATERLGRQPRIDELDRTPAQRRADALVEMARRSAGTRMPGEPAVRDLTLRMDYATFVAEVAAMGGTRDVTYPTARCSESTDGVILAPSEILDPDVALRVRRIVFDSDGQVLDYGRGRRLFEGAQRAAILERDLECQDPWCETDAGFCDVDHITEWEDGGPTDLLNGQARCPGCNRLKHQRKRQRRVHAMEFPDTA